MRRDTLFFEMKFPGKMWPMIILKNQGFTLSLENTFLYKPKREGVKLNSSLFRAIHDCWNVTKIKIFMIRYMKFYFYHISDIFVICFIIYFYYIISFYLCYIFPFSFYLILNLCHNVFIFIICTKLLWYKILIRKNIFIF